jgi:hypothetical protein
MEGMYSLSQLLGLVNHSFFNRDMRHNQYVYCPLSHNYMWCSLFPCDIGH